LGRLANLLTNQHWEHLEMGYRIQGDVFVEAHDEGFLVYAPLHNAAFTVNRVAAEFIESMRREPMESIPVQFQELAALLDRIGLMGEAPAKPKSPDDPFFPTQALLLLTENCNLRCGYCYSHGGDSKTNLPLHVAKSAIDLIVSNAVNQGAVATIRYHGGGEPTLRWETLTETVTYLRASARDSGIPSHIALNTNGVLSEVKIAWIAKNIDSVFISFDGPREVQNLQRPLASGRGTFDSVWHTMERFSAMRKPFAIRSTITAENCDCLPELVEMVASLGISGIELEPLTRCGRAYTTGAMPPTPQQYIHAYKEAHRRARELDVRLLYSGIRLGGVSPIFCGAAGRNFAVTPSGLATMCHRVSDPSEPGADSYIFGGYSEASGRFEFDFEKVDRMAGLHCESSSACKDCFAKWNCSGGCYTQNQAETGALLLSERNEKCDITRELTKFAIAEKLKQPRLPS